MDWHGSRANKVLSKIFGCRIERCFRRKNTKGEPSATAPPAAGHSNSSYTLRVDASTLGIIV